MYTGEVAYLLFEQGRGQFSILRFDPKYDVLYFSDLKAKIDEIAYIYFYQGMRWSNYNIKSPYTVEKRLNHK